MPFSPKRIVSLQPSLTVTINAFGELDRIVGCTKYCADVVPAANDGNRLIIEDTWSAKAEQIIAAKPDLVVASVPYRMESLAEIMKAGVTVLAFAPKCLDDIYRDTQYLAGILQVPERGSELIHHMHTEIANIQQHAAQATSRPRVYCEEWGKPMIHSQQWVAELVDIAGGEFIGKPGTQTTSEAITQADPDIILAAWCGAGDRVPLERIVVQRGWQHLRAVAARKVYCVNDEFLNTPAITLLSGLRAIASAIHPSLFGESAPGLRRIAP